MTLADGGNVAHLKADRRLYVTAEKDQVVEEGDPRGAYLLYAVGRVIGAGDIERYGLEADEFGRVVYGGCPKLPEIVLDQEPDPEESDDDQEPDDSDRNNEEPPDEAPKWTGRTSVEAYLERYPDGPKSELARAVIAARDDGVDGGS